MTTTTIECAGQARQRGRTRTMQLATAMLANCATTGRDPEALALKAADGALYPWPKPNDTTDPLRALFPEDLGSMRKRLAMVWEQNCPRRLYVRAGADGRYTRQGLLDGIASLLCYQLGDRGHPCGIRDVYDAVAQFCGEPRS